MKVKSHAKIGFSVDSKSSQTDSFISSTFKLIIKINILRRGQGFLYCPH